MARGLRSLVHHPIRSSGVGGGPGGPAAPTPSDAFQGTQSRFDLYKSDNFTYTTTGHSAHNFSFWVYFADSNRDQYIFDLWRATSARKAAIMLDNSGSQFIYSGDGAGGSMTCTWPYSLLPASLLSGGKPVNDTWMHLNFTLSGATNAQLHVNGVLKGTGTPDRYPEQGSWSDSKIRIMAFRNAGSEMSSGSRICQFRIHLGWTNRAAFINGDDGGRWQYPIDQTVETELDYGWPLSANANGAGSNIVNLSSDSGTFGTENGPILLSRS